MSGAAASLTDPSAAELADGPPRGWIQSPAFDLALFTLAPLSGLLVIAAGEVPGGYRLGLAAMFLVAIPHYMSSFTFYLGDDNLRHYRARRLAFFAGPAIILALVVLLRLTGHNRPVQSTMFVWNIYHVALQSAGILAIYRRLNGGPPGEQRVAKLAILATNAAMALWYVERYEPLVSLLRDVHQLAPAALKAVSLPVALAACAVLGLRIARRPRPISLAEGGFLVTSLLLFHPYLWVPETDRATFAMLMGHFLQYLAIVWLLNHRKYAHAGGSVRQRSLGWVSARPWTVVAALTTIGLTFYAADQVTTALGLSMAYVIIWNGMTLVHFYVDGLVWAFRQPHVQQTVAPFLLQRSRIKTS